MIGSALKASLASGASDTTNGVRADSTHYSWALCGTQKVAKTKSTMSTTVLDDGALKLYYWTVASLHRALALCIVHSIHHSRTAYPSGKVAVRKVDGDSVGPSFRRRKWPSKLSELPARR